MTHENTKDKNTSCSIQKVDYNGITCIDLSPDVKVSGYRKARDLADSEAVKVMKEHMLVSWYDRDRNIQSPQHTGDCSGIPGYIEYGMSRCSTLKVDIEKGRFVFFYTKIVL